jgi:HEPN domain-containing protein
MPLDDRLSGSPADWLRYARSDLELASVTRPDEVLFEGLCFHAQQAAEKALEAVLIANGIPPPKTHNIRTLLDLLSQVMVAPQEIEDSAGLADYAVTSRYPGDFEPVNEEEYKGALRLAKSVVNWAEKTVQ